MRILVFEYITGGGFAGAPLPESLLEEGELMLRALLADLATIPGVELQVPRDPRLPAGGLPGTLLRADGPIETLWPQWLAGCDAVWPVAPESDGVLERLSRAAEDSGRLLLGCRSDAVRTAASKLETAFRLGALGLPVVPTHRGLAPALWGAGPWVAKPDDGVGCCDTRLFRRPVALGRWLRGHPDAVVQPYREGIPASLSLLCREGCARVLAVNRQRISIRRGRLRLEGLEVNALGGRPGPWASLAAAVARALPGLWGYVGVDFVLTPDGPEILEVNPRLTSAYAGLSRALGVNVARLVLDLAAGAPLPEVAGGGRVALDFEVAHVA